MLGERGMERKAREMEREREKDANCVGPGRCHSFRSYMFVRFCLSLVVAMVVVAVVVS